jgi:uncharacterized protein
LPVVDRTYPHGVPCWVNTEQPDVDAAQHFYGSLFGWSFANAMPPGAPGYWVATLNGLEVAAIAPGEGRRWNTYVAVDDADAAAVAVTEAGGTLITPPRDPGPGGRTATCADPEGAQFRLWQARRRPGAQLVNAPGTWNFSDVHVHDLTREANFYNSVFGWTASTFQPGGAVRVMSVPGYGDHLESTVDPDIRTRQAGAPAGFADVVGSLVVAHTTEKSHWHVRFTVGDRDAAAATAERLGATVLASSDQDWNRDAIIRDPQGAVLTISAFSPPD